MHHKKNRLETGQFLVEGEKLLAEALSAGFKCYTVFVRRKWHENHADSKLPFDGSQPDLIFLGDSDMERISQLSSPPPIIAVFEWKKVPMPAWEPGKRSIWMYLDRIRDAGNLGTLLRIADWFGVEGVYTAPSTVDPWNAKSIQASMGSVFRVPVVENEITKCLDHLNDIPVYAATLKGTALASINFEKGGLLLLGNESEGLSRDLLKYCTMEISIPGYGQAESLNAAVAGGIILSWMRK